MKLALPQEDTNAEARQRALAERKREYAYTTFEQIPIGKAFYERDRAGPAWANKLFPALVDNRRNLEAFLAISGAQFRNPLPTLSDPELKKVLLAHDFVALFGHFLADLGTLATPAPRDLGTYRRIFQTEPLPKVANLFFEDWVFARGFVAGPNPIFLRRLDRPLENFPVTDDLYRVRPELETDRLHAAVGAGRVFVADYAVLDVLRPGEHPEGPKYVAQPMVMLAVPPRGGSLVPVAIQGSQEPGSPIFTPRDNWAWQLAKQAVRAADGCYHEVLAHLGLTHLVIEAFVVATRRCLSEQHPVYALLEEHFEGTLPINSLAVKRLLQPGTVVDRLVSANMASVYQLLARERRAFRFRAHRLPQALQSRGLDDAARLSDYPYRDDGLRVWKAIAGWVRSYVSHHYPNDGVVGADQELQDWGRELQDTTKGAIADLVIDEGFRTREALEEVLTLVVFTASAQHAAVNFPQKSDMAFCPAFPLSSYAPFPTSPELTEQDFDAALPPLDVALRTAQTLVLLGSVHHGQLGHYAAPRFAEGEVAESLGRFQRELADLETAIAARNQGVELPYVHLMPSRIPQSINI